MLISVLGRMHDNLTAVEQGSKHTDTDAPTDPKPAGSKTA